MSVTWKKMECKYYNNKNGKCKWLSNCMEIKPTLFSLGRIIQKYCSYDLSWESEESCGFYEKKNENN